MAQGVLGFFQTCIWLVRKIGLFWLEVRADRQYNMHTLHVS